MGGYPSEAEVEARSFQLINQDRANQGLPALTLDGELSQVARMHSQDMRDSNYFAHNDLNGNSPSSRMRVAGISFKISGENIARTSGLNDPAGSANDEFLNDPEHRNVLLNQQFTRVGVGVSRSGGEFWITQDYIGR
jgi:uncharacterized protein YkwD